MPFRQLPNTDTQRMQAMETASVKSAGVDPAVRAFSDDSQTSLDTTLPQFRTEMQERGVASSAQVSATTALTAQRNRLKMWASHFLQNFNFGIARGLFQASHRAFYQIPASQESLPAMTREADLLMWAQRIVDGEAAQVAAGGTAIPFPTSAEVETERNAYIALQTDQSTKKDTLDSEQEDVEAMREPVDELIEDIWDEVEFHFRKQSPPSLRANAREYGVVYVSRPGEPPEPGQPPAAPPAPNLSPGGPGEVNVDFSPVEGATSYRVEKQEVDTDPDFVAAATVNDVVTVLITATPSATLRVRVIAINESGESPASEVSELVVV